jgi:hypothetical protein
LNPNPWGDLPETAPFVLPRDRPAVEAWNAKASAATKIRTDLLPDPPLGDPLSAAVIVLALNPSVGEGDYLDHQGPLRDHIRSALTNVTDFFFLRDELATTTGATWWRNKLAPLIEATSLDAVRRHVAGAQLHQYHSKSAAPLLKPSSGRHNVEVVRKALRKGVPVLALTGVATWRVADPDFRAYPFFEPRSPQSMVVSPKNMPDGFEAAVRAIEAASS